MADLSQLKFPSTYGQLAQQFIDDLQSQSLVPLPIKLALASLGLPDDIFKDPHSTLSGEQIKNLFKLGSLFIAGKPLSLRLARYIKDDTMGMFGLAIINAANPWEALNIFRKYIGYYAPGFDFSFEEDATYMDVIIQPLVDFGPGEAVILELILCIYDYYVSRINLNGQTIYQLPYPIDADKQADYQQALSYPVVFDAPMARIRTPIADRYQPIANSNSTMQGVYLQHLEELSNASNISSYSVRAKKILLSNLQQGNLINREQLAEFLVCSHRTLTRRLKEEGNSFQGLLDEVRQVLAKQYLKSSDLPIKSIAAKVGIKNPTVFNRAFKKWCGMSPGEYRECHKD